MRARRLAGLLLTLGLQTVPALALSPPERPLTDRMGSAGLLEVRRLDDRRSVLRGLLPGAGESRLLLFAGCGPGGEASRGAALAVAAELARTPRRHTLELVLCPPGGAEPRAAQRAAEAWLALHPEPEERGAVLAALHLEVGHRPAGRGVALLLAAAADGRRRLPPAWLAHAALTGAGAAGGRLALGEPGWPLMGQLLARYGRLRAISGAEPFLAAGVPALTLAGQGPDPGWPAVVAATARRIDSLAGRPRADDVYLALGGRIWTRRDLYWCGLAVFVALLIAGRPGRWRATGSDERRRRGHRYLPGFAARMVYLLLLLAMPVATLVLVAPAMLLALVPARRPLTTALVRSLAVTPTLLFAGYWAAAAAGGLVSAWPAHPVRLALGIAGICLGLRGIGGGRGTGSISGP